MYTSGALLLSNDGEFIYHITHPKHEKTKTYVAVVPGEIDNKSIEKLRSGIKIDDYITSVAKVSIISFNKQENKTKVEIVIHEGKNRQVRKMLEAIGKKTLELERTKIDSIDVKDLKQGTWRYLKQEEVDKLMK